MTVPCDEHTPRIIRTILGKREPQRIRDRENTYRRAGVLIPLFKEAGVCKVLFIERTRHVTHHKGQIAFPGGRVEEGDGGIEDTVLREVDEEIGVSRDDVDLLGPVDDARTLTSNYLVHPLVGQVPYPYDFTIDPGEVERIHTVPLAVFHPREHRYRRDSVNIEGVTYNATAYEYEALLIWGATARIIENFMDIVGEALPLEGA